MGRFIRNIQRQPTASISQPPSKGAPAAPTAPAAAQIPMALPRRAPSNVAARIARLLGISIAAPVPCSTRPASSHGKVGANVHSSDATANSTRPDTSNRRRPNRSPAAPPVSSRALSGSR